MAQYPLVQKKLHNEIDDIVGDSRLPSLADRAAMPYADAVMHELLRLSSIVPLGVFHKAMKDVDFHGYRIPKDTMIFANLYAVHHDPKVYKNPGVFLPERFLGEEGKTLKSEAFLPFSTGKRGCEEKNRCFFVYYTFKKFSACPVMSNVWIILRI